MRTFKHSLVVAVIGKSTTLNLEPEIIGSTVSILGATKTRRYVRDSGFGNVIFVELATILLTELQTRQEVLQRTP